MQGAVENVLERSTHIQLLDGSTQELDQYSRDLILQSLHDMSMSALRCLGFAYTDVPSDFATMMAAKTIQLTINFSTHPAILLLSPI